MSQVIQADSACPAKSSSSQARGSQSRRRRVLSLGFGLLTLIGAAVISQSTLISSLGPDTQAIRRPNSRPPTASNAASHQHDSSIRTSGVKDNADTPSQATSDELTAEERFIWQIKAVAARRANLQAVFDLLDVTGGGNLQKHVVADLLKRQRDQHQQLDNEQAVKLHKLERKRIDEMDTDGDGLLSADEFCGYLGKNLMKDAVQFNAIVAQFSELAKGIHDDSTARRAKLQGVSGLLDVTGGGNLQKHVVADLLKRQRDQHQQLDNEQAAKLDELEKERITSSGGTGTAPALTSAAAQTSPESPALIAASPSPPADVKPIDIHDTSPATQGGHPADQPPAPDTGTKGGKYDSYVKNQGKATYPSACNTCLAGGAGDRGVSLVGGICQAWCSTSNYCGTGGAFKTSGSTDCRTYKSTAATLPMVTAAPSKPPEHYIGEPSGDPMIDARIIGLVVSGRSAFERRQAIRETWARDYPNVVFIVGDKPCRVPPAYRTAGVQPAYNCKAGSHVSPSIQEVYDAKMVLEDEALRAEASQHGDVKLVPMEDYYRTLPRKVKEAYRWALANTNAKWFVKIDDDAFARMSKLETYLLSQAGSEYTVVGRIRRDCRVPKSGKWADLDYQKPNYPPFANGAQGHAVTREVARRIVKHDGFEYQGEDVSMGIWINDMKLDVKWILSTQFVADGRCTDTSRFVIGHNISPQGMRQCWKATGTIARTQPTTL